MKLVNQVIRRLNKFIRKFNVLFLFSIAALLYKTINTFGFMSLYDTKNYTYLSYFADSNKEK